MSVSATAFVGRLFGPSDQRVVSTAIYRWNNGVPYISLSLGGDVTLFLDSDTVGLVITALQEGRKAMEVASEITDKITDHMYHGSVLVPGSCLFCSGSQAQHEKSVADAV